MTEPEQRFRHHPLLGTVVDIRIGAVGARRDAELLDRLIVDEMMRLQAILSAVDPDSDLERWKRGDLRDLSPELHELLALALAVSVSGYRWRRGLCLHKARAGRQCERVSVATRFVLTQSSGWPSV